MSSASIYQESKSGRWVAAVVIGRENGRPRRRKVTAATREEVERKLEGLTETVAVAPEHDGKMTTGAWLDAWLAEVERTRSPGTARNYRDVVTLYVKPHVGTVPLAQLKSQHVERMLARLAELGKSPNTQRLARSTLRRALTIAHRRGMVARNVALGQYVEGPRVAGTAADARQLLPAELNALLDAAAEHRLGGAVLLQALTGLRSGELLGLRWDDVDFRAGTITVRGALKRGGVWAETKTKGSRRTIALPPAAIETLRARRNAQAVEAEVEAGRGWSNPLGLVWTSLRGSGIDSANYRHLVARFAAAAGLGHLHPHDLRHAFASMTLASTGDLKLAAETLGHSSVRVTGDTYAHLAAGATGAATAAVAAALGR